MLIVQLPSSGRLVHVVFRRRTEGLRREPLANTTRDRLLPANPNNKGKATKGAALKVTEVEVLSPANQCIEQEAIIPLEPTVLARAKVVWNPMDPYIKRDGQRKALTMVLNYLTGLGITTREDRAIIWAAWCRKGPSQPEANAQ